MEAPRASGQARTGWGKESGARKGAKARERCERGASRQEVTVISEMTVTCGGRICAVAGDNMPRRRVWGGGLGVLGWGGLEGLAQSGGFYRTHPTRLVCGSAAVESRLLDLRVRLSYGDSS